MISLAGSLGVAFAAESAASAGSIVAVQAAPMADAQSQQKLQSEGYANVQVRGHDKNRIDVTATKNGATQNLSLNPETGAAMADTDED